MTERSYGFELLQERYIVELKTRARFYRHVQTGAELLSMISDDENKVFGITFRTPPRDSTGVAHILEHSVLCGSRRYPVKEPFVEILKGSLQTFLNAFTYPDRTCYPVASQNAQDFYNLIDVYLDAVFYPRITPEIFQQEGWHYEMEALDGPLVYRGVVFNEMKGANSSPDRLLAEYSQQSLFPDNTYGLDSGGDPTVIPELGYEQFRDFHRKYYHPSNARIFFAGDDDPEERLRLTNDYLKDFQKIKVDSAISLQPRFDGPRRVVRSFAAGDDSSRSMMTVNWMFSETKDAVTNMALHILGYILLGTPGSPLRKALIESGLGEDVTGGGLESELRQMFFSVGLKGIDDGKADAVEALILKTLEELSADGIEPEAVGAAVNTIEFGLRENNTGSYPRGLVLMLRAMTTWLYDGDPLTLLSFEPLMSEVKSRIASEKSFFADMIRKYFLDNPHRTTVIIEPDTNLKDEMDLAERQKLGVVRGSVSPEELENIFKNAEQLKKNQEAPDSPDALATIPILKLADLEKKNRIIPLAVLDEKGATVLYHDISTNGIVYVETGLNLRSLPRKYVQYIPLFSRALLEMGTKKEDYVEISRRIDRKTGGVHPSLFISEVKNTGDVEARLFLCGKAMLPQVRDLFDIIRDLLIDVRLDNRERFRQMVLEEKARQEQQLIPGGHQAVNLRLRAHFSKAGWLAEQLNGVSYLFFLRELAGRIDKDWPSVHAALEEIRSILVRHENMLFNITVDETEWEKVRPHLAGFAGKIPAGPVGTESDIDGDLLVDMNIPGHEGLIVPSQINYVGKGANIYRAGYTYHGSIRVITRYLRTSWLWDRVRVRGGAYGAFCSFDKFSGVLTFLSYRDPNLLKTIEAFDETAGFLRNCNLGDDELTKGIIGAIGDMDAYMFPDARGYTSMVHYLTGNTEEDIQRVRDEILSTTAQDFKKFAGVIDEVAKNGLVKILGSENAIAEAAGGKLPPLNILKVL
ncbi:MAG: insulinase family protein [Thermodesulfobacteriota bacterium]|nr:insulinase family protein [Thermodesulfobacteriota bacterium]